MAQKIIYFQKMCRLTLNKLTLVIKWRFPPCLWFPSIITIFFLFIYSFKHNFILKRNLRVMSHLQQIIITISLLCLSETLYPKNKRFVGGTVPIWIIWFKYYNSIFGDTYFTTLLVRWGFWYYKISLLIWPSSP